ncbi:hypothetical protein LWC34_51170 [Kibdelosporangium philippinense]|uniref:Excalibur calcium-binding domain-containing protein n=2 Tax=Kibdelosporangium philippinense TaxID=211113 RepID=A0ABS8ZTT0_9PSEU|nr:hypothetical protein [Kibdelosporangium philippinense]MCE7011114.1 hypothetical protein [Kibdelosporangium philippinense]
MTGLFMLPAEVTVTVTREEQDQQALARYPVTAGVARQVVAELAWCTIETGKYRGERAVEVRLDGMRVGELTHTMSERYQDLLTEITASGYLPGCEALVYIGKRGIEVSLRLPRVETRVAIPAARPTLPAHAPVPQKKPRNRRRPVWIPAGVVGFLLTAGLVNSGDEKPTSSAPIADLAPATTTTTVPVTLEPLTTTSSADPTPPPSTTAKKPTSTKKTTPPPTSRAAEEPAKGKCDPNYSGCVPIAEDVDCAGKGNGPAYVDGPVRVIGTDIYGLDNNNDGIGCEK